jgi:hypothetical protein
MTGGVITACKMEGSACGEEVRRFSKSKNKKKNVLARSVKFVKQRTLSACELFISRYL